MSARCYKMLSDKEWDRLEKIWKDEGLTLPQLSVRFGLSKRKIGSYLRDKHGSSMSPNYNDNVWRTK